MSEDCQTVEEHLIQAAKILLDDGDELYGLLINLCATLTAERDPLPYVPVTADYKDQENYMRLHNERLVKLASTIRIVREEIAVVRAAGAEDVSSTQLLTKKVQELIREKLGLDEPGKIYDNEDA